MISYAQIIVLSIGIVLAAVSIVRFIRKKDLISFVWFVIGAVFIAAVLLFDKIRFIGEGVFKLEVMDFFLFFAVLLLFIMMFFMHNKITLTQEKLNQLIEFIAVNGAKEKIKRKNQKKEKGA